MYKFSIFRLSKSMNLLMKRPFKNFKRVYSSWTLKKDNDVRFISVDTLWSIEINIIG